MDALGRKRKTKDILKKIEFNEGKGIEKRYFSLPCFNQQKNIYYRLWTFGSAQMVLSQSPNKKMQLFFLEIFAARQIYVGKKKIEIAQVLS